MFYGKVQKKMDIEKFYCPDWNGGRYNINPANILTVKSNIAIFFLNLNLG